MRKRKVKKHLGIYGYKPSARIHMNVDSLYCENCRAIPDYTSTKEYFVPSKWYQLSRCLDTCTWIICSDCYTPLRVKENI